MVGLGGVRTEVAMPETLDGHGRLELMKFHTPPARVGDPSAQPNTLGIRRVAFAVDEIDSAVAGRKPPAWGFLATWSAMKTRTDSAMSSDARASSSCWPSRSAEAFGRVPNVSAASLAFRGGFKHRAHFVAGGGTTGLTTAFHGRRCAKPALAASLQILITREHRRRTRIAPRSDQPTDVAHP